MTVSIKWREFSTHGSGTSSMVILQSHLKLADVLEAVQVNLDTFEWGTVFDFFFRFGVEWRTLQIILRNPFIYFLNCLSDSGVAGGYGLTQLSLAQYVKIFRIDVDCFASVSAKMCKWKTTVSLNMHQSFSFIHYNSDVYLLLILSLYGRVC